MDSEKPSYKDPPREITYFAYKKQNHFNEWLAQFQAKENTDIPQDIIEAVLRELKKERITDPKKIKKEKPLPNLDSEFLMELPSKWEIVHLGRLSKQITDGTHHTPKYVKSGVKFLSEIGRAHV